MITRILESRFLGKNLGRKATLAASALALAALWAVSPAEARVPFFNAACPGRIDVQADGGQVFINGQPARVKRFNEGYYEARLGGIVVAITIGPDGRAAVSYAARGMGKGACMVRGERLPPRDGFGRPGMPPMQDGFDRPGDGRPGDGRPGYGRPGDRPGRPGNGPMDQMVAACRAEASAQFRIRPSDIMTSMPSRDGRRLVVQGSFRDRGRQAAFNCWFDANGRLLSVR